MAQLGASLAGKDSADVSSTSSSSRGGVVGVGFDSGMAKIPVEMRRDDACVEANIATDRAAGSGHSTRFRIEIARLTEASPTDRYGKD
jgi:hypothetical protein